MKFTQISANETYFLRQRVLTPDLTLEETKRPGDEIALHFAIIYDEKEYLAIISVYPETQDGEYSDHVWRIRGMAVDNSVQGRGVGKSLLTHTIQYLRSHFDTKQVWCNSRQNATGFYEKLGFTKMHEEYVDHHPTGMRIRLELNFS